MVRDGEGLQGQGQGDGKGEGEQGKSSCCLFWQG